MKLNTYNERNKIKVFVNDRKKQRPIPIGKLQKDNNRHIFEYVDSIQDIYMLSLRMPVTQKFYYREYDLLPFFDMYIPEGYLYEIFKNILIKNFDLEPNFNDFYILNMLAPDIIGRVVFNANDSKQTIKPVDFDYIKNNDSFDTFKYLLDRFLTKNAISGVQPKTIITVEEETGLSDRATVYASDYIIKTWGQEYPYLAENEYFCMQAVKKAGIHIPQITLSKNKNFLIIKKFTDQYTGFEEVLSLFGLTKQKKYTGSYEKIAKLIQTVSSNISKDMKLYYKLVVMNYLLGNGDAHLKNFAVLYDFDLTNIRLSPAYDVVCTVAYIKNDQPALTLNGKKIWFKKEPLISFGKKYCLLSHQESTKLYEECVESVAYTINQINNYIKDNPHFEEVAKRMTKFWESQINGDSL